MLPDGILELRNISVADSASSKKRILEQAAAENAPLVPRETPAPAPPAPSPSASAGEEHKPLPAVDGREPRAHGFRIPRERAGAWQARTVLIDRRSGQAEA